MLRIFTTIVTLCGLLASVAPQCVAAAPVDLRTNKNFREELDAPLLASWSGVPVRAVLNRLSKERRIAIWLDRRVDPGKLVDFSPRDIPLRQALDQLAEKTFCRASIVESVVYVGPARACENLATLAAVKRAEVQRLAKPRAARLMAAAAWSWPERAEPKTLVQQLLDEAGVTPTNLAEAVPHDLWPALELPPTPWADRLTLVLAGFGVTYELSDDGRQVTFVRWPEKISYEFSYSVTGDAKGMLDQLRNRFPAADLRLAGTRLAVKGRYEDHEEIARVVRGDSAPRTTKVGTGTKTYTLNVERQPLGPLAKTLADRLGLQIEIAPELDPQLKELVTFKVEEVTVEEVWKALAKAARVSAQVSGNKVVLKP